MQDSKDHIMLFKISMGKRKSSNENYQQFGSTLSKTLANSGLDEDEGVLLNLILNKKSLDSIYVDRADPIAGSSEHDEPSNGVLKTGNVLLLL
jgi:hypothetical protein